MQQIVQQRRPPTQEPVPANPDDSPPPQPALYRAFSSAVPPPPVPLTCITSNSAGGTARSVASMAGPTSSGGNENDSDGQSTRSGNGLTMSRATNTGIAPALMTSARRYVAGERPAATRPKVVFLDGVRRGPAGIGKRRERTTYLSTVRAIRCKMRRECGKRWKGGGGDFLDCEGCVRRYSTERRILGACVSGGAAAAVGDCVSQRIITVGRCAENAHINSGRVLCFRGRKHRSYLALSL